MAKLTKKQRKDAYGSAAQKAVESGTQGAFLGASIGAPTGVGAPVGAGIGAAVGVFTGGISGYLMARKELLELQKIEGAQKKLDTEAAGAAKAEGIRQRGALARQFDDAYADLLDTQETQLGMMSPGISSYDAYHSRRFG